MRKMAITALLFALAVGFMPARADHAARTVSGSILVPTVTVPSVGIFSRQARCAYLLAGEDSNGLVGWVVELDADEGDGDHTFTASAAGADIAVVFYESLGTCDNAPGPVTTGDSLNPGDEAGVIPFGTTSAIVVVEGAANAAFEFAIA